MSQRFRGPLLSSIPTRLGDLGAKVIEWLERGAAQCGRGRPRMDGLLVGKWVGERLLEPSPLNSQRHPGRARERPHSPHPRYQRQPGTRRNCGSWATCRTSSRSARTPVCGAWGRHLRSTSQHAQGAGALFRLLWRGLPPPSTARFRLGGSSGDAAPKLTASRVEVPQRERRAARAVTPQWSGHGRTCALLIFRHRGSGSRQLFGYPPSRLSPRERLPC